MLSLWVRTRRRRARVCLRDAALMGRQCVGFGVVGTSPCGIVRVRVRRSPCGVCAVMCKCVVVVAAPCERERRMGRSALWGLSRRRRRRRLRYQSYVVRAYMGSMFGLCSL